MIDRLINTFVKYLKTNLKNNNTFYGIFSYGTVVCFEKTEEKFIGFPKNKENQLTFDSLTDIFTSIAPLIHNAYKTLFYSEKIDDISYIELQDPNGFKNYIVRYRDKNYESLIIPFTYHESQKNVVNEAIESRKLDWRFPKLIAIIEPNFKVHKIDVYDEITDFSVN